jgi:hypothetical protein
VHSCSIQRARGLCGPRRQQSARIRTKYAVTSLRPVARFRPHNEHQSQTLQGHATAAAMSPAALASDVQQPGHDDAGNRLAPCTSYAVPEWWKQIDVVKAITRWLPSHRDVLTCDCVCRDWSTFRVRAATRALDRRAPSCSCIQASHAGLSPTVYTHTHAHHAGLPQAAHHVGRKPRCGPSPHAVAGGQPATRAAAAAARRQR